MTSIARRTAALLAACSLLPAAGCGGEDSSQSDAYVSSMNRIQSQLVSGYQRLASEITTSTPRSEDAETLDKLGDAISLTVARLKAVDVPDEVQGQHERLTEALGAYRDDVNASSEALAADAGTSAEQARKDLTDQTTALSETFARVINEINTRLQNG